MYDCHLFFKTLADKKKDKVEFKVIAKINEGCFSIRYGCVRSIDSYRFSSISLKNIIETLVDDSHESLKSFKKRIVGDNNKSNIANELEKLLSMNENKRSIENSNEDYPDKIDELEEDLLNYV